MRRSLRPTRPRSDALVVREYFFPPGTPVPEIMAEIGHMTPDELRELADEARRAVDN